MQRLAPRRWVRRPRRRYPVRHHRLPRRSDADQRTPTLPSPRRSRRRRSAFDRLGDRDRDLTPIVIGTATDTPTGTPPATVSATATPTGITGPRAPPPRPVPSDHSATATFTPTGIPPDRHGDGHWHADRNRHRDGHRNAHRTTVPTATATDQHRGGSRHLHVDRPTPTVVIPATSTAPRATPLPIVATIMVGSASGAPGSTVTFFDVTLDTDGRGRWHAERYRLLSAGPHRRRGRRNTRLHGESRHHEGPDLVRLPPFELHAGHGLHARPGHGDLVSRSRSRSRPARSSTPATSRSPPTQRASSHSPAPIAGAGDPDGDKLGTDCTNGTITAARRPATPTTHRRRRSECDRAVALNSTVDDHRAPATRHHRPLRVVADDADVDLLSIRNQMPRRSPTNRRLTPATPVPTCAPSAHRSHRQPIPTGSMSTVQVPIGRRRLPRHRIRT